MALGCAYVFLGLSSNQVSAQAACDLFFLSQEKCAFPLQYGMCCNKTMRNTIIGPQFLSFPKCDLVLFSFKQGWGALFWQGIGEGSHLIVYLEA